MYEKKVKRRHALRRLANVPASAAFLALISLLSFTACGVGAGSPGTSSGGSTPSGSLNSNSTTLDFGSVTVGTSASKSVTITNVGDAAISITAIGASGTGYSVSGVTVPVNLSPSQSVTATVKFTPASAGAVNGSLTITTDTQGKNLSLPLNATAVAPGVAQLSANPAPVAFGGVTIGSSVSKTVTLSNIGSATASVGSVTYSGPGFNVSGISAPLSLGAGKSTTFQVAFAPSGVGSTSGSIVLKDSGGATLLSVSMSGTGNSAAAHSVDLSWTASASVVAGYRIYRGTISGGPYTIMTSSLLTTTTYHDANVVAGNSYFYVVTAVDSLNVESGFSNEAAVTIPNP